MQQARLEKPPDIDVDFEHERREEVMQYVYQRYGRNRAALVSAVITYRPRSAIRDVGRALGLSQDQIDCLAKNIGSWHDKKIAEQRIKDIGLDPKNPVLNRVLKLKFINCALIVNRETNHDYDVIPVCYDFRDFLQL